MSVHIEKVNYHGWNNCYRLSNDQIELILVADIGPRIIHFSRRNGENRFAVIHADLGKNGGNKWRLYGGHRLWHAPESMPRTYYPDNRPVEVLVLENGVHVRQSIESSTGIQKEMVIRLDADDEQVHVSHFLKNTNLWPVELAPWTLSVMAPGGVAILPLPERGSHESNLLPTSTIALWAYTNLADPRWSWGKQVILLRQETQAPSPLKIGLSEATDWLAYAHHGELFIKKFDTFRGQNYPDKNCASEVFTNHEILELESLGPLTKLETGEVAQHNEHWWLLEGVPEPVTVQQVEEEILPMIPRSTR